MLGRVEGTHFTRHKWRVNDGRLEGHDSKKMVMHEAKHVRGDTYHCAAEAFSLPSLEVLSANAEIGSECSTLELIFDANLTNLIAA